MSEAEQLSLLWDERWGTPPVGHFVRYDHPDRWVRFHSLPGSKRYAETDSEMAEILRRHHALLDALGLSDWCYVIAPRVANEPADVVGRPDGWHWRTIDDRDYWEEPADICVSRMSYSSEAFDAMLRAVADWKIADVILGPADLRWLYHPYDGGADVIAASSDERDRLREDFADWLSSHPQGL